MDFRCIHDTDKGVAGKAIRGTLSQSYEQLLQYNQNGYGVFVCINAMDGLGRNLANVDHIRTHIVDMDNPMSSQANYQAAIASNFPPHFATETSAGKYHLYWLVEPYQGNDFYSTQQRKLRQLYDGDKSVIDASRVLRVPGFYHLKDPSNPFLVHCWSVSDIPRYQAAQLEQCLAHVNVFDSHGGRFQLGEESLQADSLEWLQFGLSKVRPEDMSYEEWMSLTAAYKQAGWNLTDEETLLNIWLEWCSQYAENDLDVNMKLWNSIKDTEIGWPSIKRRTTIDAYMRFGHKEAPEQNDRGVAQGIEQLTSNQQVAGLNPAAPATPPMPTPKEPTTEDFGEILGGGECAIWFNNCFFIEREGKMFTNGRFMNSTSFNGKYGGKHFIITSTGKTTDEAWKAALRSTVWSVPKVDHVRFLPTEPSYSVIEDAMGRKGLNTYISAKIVRKHGDVKPWLTHVAKILPDPNDQKILFDYLAHCVKFPGHKIPWAPMLQSMEGVGKSVFFEVMSHALGSPYVYRPKAQELVSSGSTFNAWMRSKLMIVVDEIKIDERRELIEILKPMITEAQIEIQSKGVDQEMEDNVANWLFFSNYKDAIPININGRRYCIFYSAIQTLEDLLQNGMNHDYFTNLWRWLREEDGLEYIAQWFMDYPIDVNGLPVRAPQTTSHAEALKISRSPMEVVIQDCIADNTAGFIGGFVSSLAVVARCKEAGIRQPSARAVQTCLEGMGFTELGKSPTAYFQESATHKPTIYGASSSLNVNDYGAVQGYA